MEDFHNKRITDAKILQFAALSDLNMLQDIERKSGKKSSSSLISVDVTNIPSGAVRNSPLGNTKLRSKSSDGPRDESNKKTISDSTSESENLIAQQIRLANLREQVSTEKIEWYKSRDEEFKKATELKSRIRRSNLLPKSDGSSASNDNSARNTASTPLSNQEYLDEWLAGKVPDILPSSLKHLRSQQSNNGLDKSNNQGSNDVASVALQQELNRLKEEIKALREGNATSQRSVVGNDAKIVKSMGKFNVIGFI